ncbi:MAG: SEC-C domain-containing protein [Deltaproteobacteria bacterium]|jgi:hypothetical protein|nr:SEC-C domain-containing protein [Deltaproteobacteria bacterium]
MNKDKDKVKVNIEFSRYNPKEKIVPCPPERLAVRDALDIYARASINLYGAIAISDLVMIFNQRNADKTSEKEIFDLLLPLVTPATNYCFYKNYLVNSRVKPDFDWVEKLLAEQFDKPRYLPKGEAFLKFAKDGYRDNKEVGHWHKLYNYVSDQWQDNIDFINFFQALEDFSLTPFDSVTFKKIIKKNNIVFTNARQLDELLTLLSEAKNNSRLWVNKGFTPNELSQKIAKHGHDLPEFSFETPFEPQPDELCPCASGKKYRSCCLKVDLAGTSRLSASECELFYQTWYGLLAFVNSKKKVIKEKIEIVYPNPVKFDRLLEVRRALWAEPSLIEEYIDSEAPELTTEKMDLLQSWYWSNKPNIFIVMEYRPEHAVFFSVEKEGQFSLYGVKGLERSVAKELLLDLPQIIEAVILPFKDKIVHDGFIKLWRVKFSQEMKAPFLQLFNQTKGEEVKATLD